MLLAMAHPSHRPRGSRLLIGGGAASPCPRSPPLVPAAGGGAPCGWGRAVGSESLLRLPQRDVALARPSCACGGAEDEKSSLTGNQARGTGALHLRPPLCRDILGRALGPHPHDLKTGILGLLGPRSGGARRCGPWGGSPAGWPRQGQAGAEPANARPAAWCAWSGRSRPAARSTGQGQNAGPRSTQADVRLHEARSTSQGRRRFLGQAAAGALHAVRGTLGSACQAAPARGRAAPQPPARRGRRRRPVDAAVARGAQWQSPEARDKR